MTRRAPGKRFRRRCVARFCSAPSIAEPPTLAGAFKLWPIANPDAPH